MTVIHGDCLAVLPTLEENSVDAIVTDPPYGLEFMGKEWDKFKGANNWGRAGESAEWSSRPKGGGDPFSKRDTPRFTAGHPFQQWCQLWAVEAFRVLKPGGHMFAFGGTRTWHRLAVAVEDAGFEIRDSIAWLYGSGFPKSLDVGKAIDKRPGVMRHAEFAKHLTERREAVGIGRLDVAERVVGTRSGAMWNWEHHQFPEAKWWPALRDLLGLNEATWGPVIAEAERARIGQHKSGLRTGDSGVGGGGVGGDITTHATPEAAQWQGWGTALKPAFEPVVVARKPLVGTVAANVLEFGTGALNVDDCRVSTSPADARAMERANTPGSGRFKTGRAEPGAMGRSKAGEPLDTTEGRWPANVVLDADAAAELDAQSGELVSGSREAGTYAGLGYMGSESADFPSIQGNSGGASRFFYTAKADTAERPTHNGISHPTVKPLDLMRWLVRLVTPPGGTVLDPFAGSGTTLEAALLEGFDFIGIEREADYLPLIQQRLDRRRDPVAYLTNAGEDLGLFGPEDAA